MKRGRQVAVGLTALAAALVAVVPCDSFDGTPAASASDAAEEVTTLAHFNGVTYWAVGAQVLRSTQ